MSKPILCLDFDGVVHSYERGWQGGEIYGSVTPGFWEWALEAERYFDLVVYSSRSKSEEGRAAMRGWLGSQFIQKFPGAAWDMSRSEEGVLVLCRNNGDKLRLRFAREKPPAFLTIDDRALTFDGEWSRFPPSALLAFKPWNVPNG